MINDLEKQTNLIDFNCNIGKYTFRLVGREERVVSKDDPYIEDHYVFCDPSDFPLVVLRVLITKTHYFIIDSFIGGESNLKSGGEIEIYLDLIMTILNILVVGMKPFYIIDTDYKEYTDAIESLFASLRNKNCHFKVDKQDIYRRTLKYEDRYLLQYLYKDDFDVDNTTYKQLEEFDAKYCRDLEYAYYPNYTERLVNPSVCNKKNISMVAYNLDTVLMLSLKRNRIVNFIFDGRDDNLASLLSAKKGVLYNVYYP